MKAYLQIITFVKIPLVWIDLEIRILKMSLSWQVANDCPRSAWDPIWTILDSYCDNYWTFYNKWIISDNLGPIIELVQSWSGPIIRFNSDVQLWHPWNLSIISVRANCFLFNGIYLNFISPVSTILYTLPVFPILSVKITPVFRILTLWVIISGFPHNRKKWFESKILD